MNTHQNNKIFKRTLSYIRYNVCKLIKQKISISYRSGDLLRIKRVNMLNRNEFPALKFDPALPKKFFEINKKEAKEVAYSPKHPFPVLKKTSDNPQTQNPLEIVTSPATLAEFFSTDAGQKFKEAFKTAMNDIIAWANDNEINTDGLIKFRDEHYKYSGQCIDAQTTTAQNTRRFPLYSISFPLLTGIAELIQYEYQLSLLSISSFEELDTSKLEKKPYLIRDKKGNYRIWGNKKNEEDEENEENQWKLTAINKSEIDFEWKQDQTIFISSKNKIFKTLKENHTKPDNIPLEKRINAIRYLASSLDECEPQSHTVILGVYAELASNSNSYAEMVKNRSQIVQLFIGELLNQYISETKMTLNRGHELFLNSYIKTHFLNRLFNLFAPELGLDQIDDPNIETYCSDAKKGTLNKLLAMRFSDPKTGITTALTAKNLLENILSSLTIDATIEELNLIAPVETIIKDIDKAIDNLNKKYFRTNHSDTVNATSIADDLNKLIAEFTFRLINTPELKKHGKSIEKVLDKLKLIELAFTNLDGHDHYLISTENEKINDKDLTGLMGESILQTAQQNKTPLFISTPHGYVVYDGPTKNGKWSFHKTKDDTFEIEEIDDKKLIELAGEFALQTAKQNRTPIFIRKKNEYLVYGDTQGKKWDFINLRGDTSELNDLPFTKKLTRHTNKQLTKSQLNTLKQGHIHLGTKKTMPTLISTIDWNVIKISKSFTAKLDFYGEDDIFYKFAEICDICYPVPPDNYVKYKKKPEADSILRASLLRRLTERGDLVFKQLSFNKTPQLVIQHDKDYSLKLAFVTLPATLADEYKKAVPFFSYCIKIFSKQIAENDVASNQKHNQLLDYLKQYFSTEHTFGDGKSDYRAFITEIAYYLKSLPSKKLEKNKAKQNRLIEVLHQIWKEGNVKDLSVFNYLNGQLQLEKTQYQLFFSTLPLDEALKLAPLQTSHKSKTINLEAFVRYASIEQVSAYLNFRVGETEKKDEHILPLAVTEQRADIVALLLKDYEYNPITPYKSSNPFLMAVDLGNPKIIEVFLTHDGLLKSDITNSKRENALEVAIAHNHLKALKMLIESNKFDNNPKSLGLLLHKAILNDQLEIVKFLLDKLPENLRNGLMLFASLHKRGEILKFLLEKLDPNYIFPPKKETLLAHVVNDRNLEMLKIILACERTNIHLGDDSGLTPLDIACINEAKEEISLLLEHGADPKISFYNKNNKTSLLHALCLIGGHEKSKKALFKSSKVDPNIQDENGCSPLFLAIEKQDLELMDLILANEKTDLTLKNNLGQTPFAYTLSLKEFAKYLSPTTLSGTQPLSIPTFVSTLESLLENKTYGEAVRKEAEETLFKLIRSGNAYGFIEVLIKAGVSLEAKDAEGHTPLEIALEMNDSNALQTLLLLGKDPEAAKQQACSLLVGAIKTANIGRIKCLVEARIPFENNEGNIFVIAAKTGNIEIVEALFNKTLLHYKFATLKNALLDIIESEQVDLLAILIEVLAKFSYSQIKDSSIDMLEKAVRKGNLKLIETLLTVININEIDPEETTALHTAVETNNPEIVTFLMGRGAAHTRRKLDSHTPLSLAADKNHPEVVKALIADKKILKQAEKMIFSAVTHDYVQTIKCLLKAGIDLNIKNKDGQTLATYLVKCNKNALVELLKAHEEFPDFYEQALNLFNSDDLGFFQRLYVAGILNLKKDNDFNARVKIAVDNEQLEILQFLSSNPYRRGLLEKYVSEAIKKGDVATIRILLPLIPDKCLNILLEAIENENLDAINILLDDLKTVIASKPAVHADFMLAAARKSNPQLMELLLTVVNINVANSDGTTALHVAAEIGNVAIVKLLMDRKALHTQKPSHHQTPLTLAVYNNHANVVQALITDKTILNQAKEMIVDAIMYTNVEPVKCILAAGIDLYTPYSSHYGKTLLAFILHTRNAEILKALLQAHNELPDFYEKAFAYFNADNADDADAFIKLYNAGIVGLKEGNDIKTRLAIAVTNKQMAVLAKFATNSSLKPSFFAYLAEAIKNGNVDAVKVILPLAKDEGLRICLQAIANEDVLAIKTVQAADPTFCVKNINLLHTAIRSGKLESTKILLTDKNVNATDANETSALHIAAETGNIEIVKLLMDHKAIHTQRKLDDKTPLSLALEKNHPEIIKLLTIDPRTLIQANQMTFLMVQDDHIEKVKCLLRVGIDLKTIGDYGIILLPYIVHRNGETLKALLQARDKFSDFYQQAFDLFNSTDDVTIFTKLHDACIMSGKQNYNIGTRIEIAVANKQANVLELFRTNQNLQPFLLDYISQAIEKKNIESIKAILPFAQDECAKMYFSAIEKGQIDIVKIFLQAGLEAIIRDKHDNMSLMIAVLNNRLDMIDLLFQYKVDPNPRNNPDSIPIMWAIQTGSINIVEKLLKNGANPNVENTYGQTPLFAAIESRNYDMVLLLLKHSANPLVKNKNKITAVQLIEKNTAGLTKKDALSIQLTFKAFASVNLLDEPTGTPKHKAIQELLAIAKSGNISLFKKALDYFEYLEKLTQKYLKPLVPSEDIEKGKAIAVMQERFLSVIESGYCTFKQNTLQESWDNINQDISLLMDRAQKSSTLSKFGVFTPTYKQESNTEKNSGLLITRHF